MARLARVIAPDIPHHITQRGNTRQFILSSDEDRAVYLQLLGHYCRLYRLALAGYCVMSNHVHLVAIPRRPESLILALKNAHGRYAAYFNARHLSSGHVWQGRYDSRPLDTAPFWAALRYVEMNPVRAGLAVSPEDYGWSSAAAHCGRGPDELVDLSVWRDGWTPAAWREYLTAGEEEAAEIRRSTHAGRLLGTSRPCPSLAAPNDQRLTTNARFTPPISPA